MQGAISNQSREISNPSFIVDGDPGRSGGGTYTHPGNARSDPTIQDYESIFGPAARDVKLDLQRNKRHARWHLPDALKGSNPWIADKIDGLITDTSSSPFTTQILPYLYIENVDQKIKWNRWSFDEGLSSRVPYESAARTLTQTKTSYAGYTVRQGLAISLEHNFMMSPKGRENFKNQLQQVVGSIQYTNDIDVHIALITAPSYAKEKAERYYTKAKTNHQVMREYIDLFGFMQKNCNAMDIMIEEARSVLRSWGAAEPSFLLTNSKLTFQMTMSPEKTEYVTQGPDGVKRLKAGPNINTYRGLNIINSRSFSMEDGAPPRDVLRRRVRTAEYYRIPWDPEVHTKSFSFYDESKDSWHRFTWKDLFRMSECSRTGELGGEDYDDENVEVDYITPKLPDRTGADAAIAGTLGVAYGAAAAPNDIVALPAPAPADNTHPNRVGVLFWRAAWDAMEGNTLRGGANVAAPAFDHFDILSCILRGHNNIAGFAIGANELRIAPPAGSGLGGAFAENIAEYTTPTSIRQTWGVVLPANAANPLPRVGSEDIYNNFASDFQAYITGKRRYLSPQKIRLFALLNLYTETTTSQIISLLFDWTRQNLTTGDTLEAREGGIPVIAAKLLKVIPIAQWEIVIVRPNIEHNMLGIVMGRGGVEELGATFWGQTELSVYDDSMHGIWGMSYKYNQRALVTNHKNLVRLWDVSYDGYNGGKDCTSVNWGSDEDLQAFKQHTYELNKAYEGPSMMVMRFKNVDTSDPWPSPIVFHDTLYNKTEGSSFIDGEHQHQIKKDAFRVFNRSAYQAEYKSYLDHMPNFTRIHNPKNAGTCSEENETSCNCLAFQGTMKIHYGVNGGVTEEISGNGHHGIDAVGMASVRSGKGISMGSVNLGAMVTRQI